MENPYIIAEIGSNWKDLHSAKKQITLAKKAGASAVKFQLFTFKELYGIEGENTHSLPREWVRELSLYCNSVNIDFLCSGFSVEGFKYLDPHVHIHKIASPEACCDKIKETVFSLGNPVILSNGCLTYDEQFEIVDGPNWGASDVLLECISKYPATEEDYDLSQIVEIAEDYDINWGISDHTKNNCVAVLARSLGASVFEKHVSFIDVGVTPDTCVSISGPEFEYYVKAIKAYKNTKYDKEKRACKKLYGRTASGYRPLP
jgi:sialic acid synthase SpsE